MDVAGVSIDLVSVSKAQGVVLVEGGSDKAAVEVLAGRRGQVLGGRGIHVLASREHSRAGIGCHGARPGANVDHRDHCHAAHWVLASRCRI
jgi:hypothetical protein